MAKPMPERDFRRYIGFVGWSLEKGSMDWKLYDEKGVFLCAIKISHGKNTKQEVVASSIRKVENKFKERGSKWPPSKKSKKN